MTPGPECAPCRVQAQKARVEVPHILKTGPQGTGCPSEAGRGFKGDPLVPLLTTETYSLPGWFNCHPGSTPSPGKSLKGASALLGCVCRMQARHARGQPAAWPSHSNMPDGFCFRLHENTVREWSCVRGILSTCEKTPRKPNQSLMTSVFPKTRTCS